MDEVTVLNDAIRETNRVLQQKGYRENTVDVVEYLQTGNTQVFTRDNGVRNAVEAIPFENMVKSVKKILIDDTIGYLGEQHQLKKNLMKKIQLLKRLKSELDGSILLNVKQNLMIYIT